MNVLNDTLFCSRRVALPDREVMALTTAMDVLDMFVTKCRTITNRFKKAFFSGVGIDGNWKNSVLFRSWIPNNTEAAYGWLLTRAIPLVVPAVIRHGIEMLQEER